MNNQIYINNLLREANAQQLRAQIVFGNTNPTLFLRSDGAWAPAGGSGGAVDSVNGRTGAVTLSKSDVGLSEVDNTSDLNKPISNATAAALDAKQPLSTVLTNTTASFTTAQESKLAGIQAGAEVNVNADWNASSGDAQILNKPIIPVTSSATLSIGNGRGVTTYTQTIIDAAVSSTSKINLWLAQVTDADENTPDMLSLQSIWGRPLSGSMFVTAEF